MKEKEDKHDKYHPHLWKPKGINIYKFHITVTDCFLPVIYIYTNTGKMYKQMRKPCYILVHL